MASVPLPLPTEADYVSGRRALLALLKPEAREQVATQWERDAAKPKPYYRK